jgi:hypothetical protein
MRRLTSLTAVAIYGSAHALSRAVQQRNRCQSGCIGSARLFSRWRKLIHWWREWDSNPRSRKREITFETAPLDDSDYLLCDRYRLLRYRDRRIESLSLRHLRIGTRRRGE